MTDPVPLGERDPQLACKPTGQVSFIHYKLPPPAKQGGRHTFVGLRYYLEGVRPRQTVLEKLTQISLPFRHSKAA